MNLLPDKVMELLPTESTVAHGAAATGPVLSQNRVDVSDGYWVFDGWTGGTQNATTDVELTGTWNFYSVENGGNTGGTGDNSNNSNSVNTTPTATQAPVQSSNAVTQNASGSAAQILIPQTGDDSQPLVWGALVVVSGAALAGLAVYRKKRSDK